jgi:hypothetical protein
MAPVMDTDTFEVGTRADISSEALDLLNRLALGIGREHPRVVGENCRMQSSQKLHCRTRDRHTLQTLLPGRGSRLGPDAGVEIDCSQRTFNAAPRLAPVRVAVKDGA